MRPVIWRVTKIPVTIPNTFVGQSTLQAANLDSNFSTIASYTSSIPGSDIQSASIPNAQLVNANMDILVNLIYQNGGTKTAVSSTRPVATFGLTNLSADTASYVVTSAAYMCTNVGTAGTLTFSVGFGYYLANTWTSLVSASALIVASTGLAGGAGPVALSGVPTITTSTISLNATNPGFLSLFITGTLDASALNVVGDSLAVSLTLKRTGGLRS